MVAQYTRSKLPLVLKRTASDGYCKISVVKFDLSRPVTSWLDVNIYLTVNDARCVWGSIFIAVQVITLSTEINSVIS